MATTPTYINQRINNLQAQINSIISGGGGGVPTSSDLADVLVNGNSAGTTDIDMNFNDITNVNEVIVLNPTLFTTSVQPSQTIVHNITTTETATLNPIQIGFANATGNSSSLSNNALVIADVTNIVTAQITPSQLTMVNTAVGSIASLDVANLQFLGSNTTNTISNSGGQLLNVTADGNLNLSSNTGDCIIGVPNQIQLNATNGDISLVSVNGNNSINLNALNVNSFSSAMPICFDFVELDRNYNYTSGGQNWELIWTQNLNVPYQFFTENPSNPYTSTKWRIDFTINTWNNSSGNNSPDKARAFYIDFQDQATSFYPTAVITSTKPFCYHNNNSTWNGSGSNSEFIPVTWTDYVDFNGLVATGSGNVPLKFNVYFTADNPKNFDFSYKLGLTRVNLL